MGVARPEDSSEGGPNTGNGGVRGDGTCFGGVVVDLPHPLSLTLQIIK